MHTNGKENDDAGSKGKVGILGVGKRLELEKGWQDQKPDGAERLRRAKVLANVGRRDLRGNTPLHWAAAGGDYPMLVTLLRDGAESGNGELVCSSVSCVFCVHAHHFPVVKFGDSL